MAGMNRKGMFFTLIAITMMIIFIALFAPAITTVTDEDSAIPRIESIDLFLREVQNNFLPLAMRVSAHNALQTGITHVNQTQDLLDNPAQELGQTMIDGTLDSTTVLENNTLTQLVEELEQRAQEAHRISLDITINEVTLTDSSPWTIGIRANFSFTAIADVANWTDSDLIVTTSAPIRGLHDPLALVESGGGYDIPITPAEDIPQDLAAFDALVTSGNFTHVENGQAPSFLQRFAKSPQDSDCCAIESMVRPDLVSPSDQEESYVHHQFWSGEVACEDLYSVSGPGFTHSSFKLDFTHLNRYNISQHASALTCT